MLSIFRGGGVSQVIVGGIAFSIILVFALEFRAGRNGPTASLKKECAVEIKGACIWGPLVIWVTLCGRNVRNKSTPVSWTASTYRESA